RRITMKGKTVLGLVLCLAVMGPTALMAQSSKAPKTIKIGLSWNEKMQSLVQAWDDYMKAYAEETGKKSGITFKWITNVADSDPSQQASNIDDLITQKIDVLIVRPHDAAAIGASIGGYLSLSLATRYPDRVRITIPIASGVVCPDTTVTVPE
ncbi:MAG: substrate-binding domain-containing protein, partial [Methanomicrobiales archaeon]